MDPRDYDPSEYPIGCRQYHLSFIGGEPCTHVHCQLLRNAKTSMPSVSHCKGAVSPHDY